MQQLLGNKLRKIEQNFQLQLKNLKPILFKEASEFVQESTKKVTAVLTN